MGLLDSPLVRKVRQSPRLRPAGVAAYRAVDRMLPAGTGPRVLANSMPKSGTHLLAELLGQLPRMRFAGRLVLFNDLHLADPGPALDDLRRTTAGLRSCRYVGAHLIHDERVQALVESSGVRLITVLRDPRAVVVSSAHYVLQATQLRGRAEALERFPDLESNLDAAVYGYGEPGTADHRPDIGVRFAQYAGWLDVDTGLVVRFEDLVGSAGGASDDVQLQTVQRVLAHVGIEADEATAARCAAGMFSEKAITFRSGTVDSWRRDLGEEREREVLARCAEPMARLGYAG